LKDLFLLYFLFFILFYFIFVLLVVNVQLLMVCCELSSGCCLGRVYGRVWAHTLPITCHIIWPHFITRPAELCVNFSLVVISFILLRLVICCWLFYGLVYKVTLVYDLLCYHSFMKSFLRHIILLLIYWADLALKTFIPYLSSVREHPTW